MLLLLLLLRLGAARREQPPQLQAEQLPLQWQKGYLLTFYRSKPSARRGRPRLLARGAGVGPRGSGAPRRVGGVAGGGGAHLSNGVGLPLAHPLPHAKID